MRQGPNNRRSRGRGSNNPGGGNGNGNNNSNNAGGHRRQSGPQRHQSFDSNGPDVRIRGTAFQVYEKYQTLARDAQTSGDRVAAENFLQHAEHYYRIILQITEQEGRHRQPDHRQGGNGHNAYANGGQSDEDEGDESGESAESGEEDREPLPL